MDVLRQTIHWIRPCFGAPFVRPTNCRTVTPMRHRRCHRWYRILAANRRATIECTTTANRSKRIICSGEAIVLTSMAMSLSFPINQKTTFYTRKTWLIAEFLHSCRRRCRRRRRCLRDFTTNLNCKLHKNTSFVLNSDSFSHDAATQMKKKLKFKTQIFIHRLELRADFHETLIMIQWLHDVDSERKKTVATKKNWSKTNWYVRVVGFRLSLMPSHFFLHF